MCELGASAIVEVELSWSRMTLAQIAKQIVEQEGELAYAAMTGDLDAAYQLSEQHQMAMEYAVELFDAIADEFYSLTAREQGYVVGRITFEILAVVGSAGTGVAVNGASKAGRLSQVISRLNNLPGIPASIKAKLSQLIAHFTDMANTKMCFVAGTSMWTPDGLCAIEAIRPGDLVLSRCELTGMFGYKRCCGHL